MEETFTETEQKEMKSQSTAHLEFQTRSSVIFNDSSIRYPEVIIGLYLLGVKPPWIMRVIYRV